MPPKLITTFRYQKLGTVNQLGTVTAGQRLNASNQYDIDPLVASTAMPGFTELAALYRFYRTEKAKIQVSFGNREGFPIVVYITPVNFDTGNNPSTTITQNLLSNPLSRSTTLGASTGSSTATLTRSASTNDFAGSPVRSIDTYVGPTSGASAPTNAFYFAYGCYSATPLVNGFDVDVVLTLESFLFELANPAA
jgi:hypothetical protein